MKPECQHEELALSAEYLGEFGGGQWDLLAKCSKCGNEDIDTDEIEKNYKCVKKTPPVQGPSDP